MWTLWSFHILSLIVHWIHCRLLLYVFVRSFYRVSFDASHAHELQLFVLRLHLLIVLLNWINLFRNYCSEQGVTAQFTSFLAWRHFNVWMFECLGKYFGSAFARFNVSNGNAHSWYKLHTEKKKKKDIQRILITILFSIARAHTDTGTQRVSNTDVDIYLQSAAHLLLQRWICRDGDDIVCNVHARAGERVCVCLERYANETKVDRKISISFDFMIYRDWSILIFAIQEFEKRFYLEFLWVKFVDIIHLSISRAYVCVSVLLLLLYVVCCVRVCVFVNAVQMCMCVLCVSIYAHFSAQAHTIE